MVHDTLKMELQLIIDAAVFRIPGGNLKNCRLDLFTYGFTGELDFWLSSGTGRDDLFAKFATPELMQMRLSIRGVHNLPTPAPEPLVVAGVVTDKAVREVSYKSVGGNPVLQRNYHIHFQDAPQVLWQQHFPTALYTDKSLADILKAQAVEGISLSFDWDKLQRKQPLFCLGLGSERNVASFYDFIMWYVDEQKGLAAYDYKNQTLIFSEHKPAPRKPVAFAPSEIQDLRIRFPATHRHNVRLLNGCSEAPKKSDITQDHAVAGVSKDILIRTDIIKDLDRRKSLEAAKLARRQPELEIALSAFPAKTFGIGTPARLHNPLWSDASFLARRVFRVFEIHLTARADKQAADENLNADAARYQLDMTAALESVDDARPHLPPYRKPWYPIYVEGNIISESGKDTDKTYQIYTHRETSRDFYNIHVPLWNRKIKVPFIPDMTTGHFYFPAFKHARVLLAIYLDHAEIDAFLDWGEGTRLSLDSQGNHILFGKSPASETSVKHIYKDNKPVFSIQRVSGTDTELIQLEDNAIILQTKEDSSRTKVDDSYDLTPKIAAARAQLAMEKEAAVYGLSGTFETTKTEVSGKIDAALAETNARLESMDTELSARIEAVNADIEASLQQLDRSAERLEHTVTTVKTDIKTRIRNFF